MQNVVSRWSALSPLQKGLIAGSALVIGLLMAWMLRAASTPQMSLLYSGLEPERAAAVLEALEAAGTRVDVRQTGIYVPLTERDALRLRLAGDGLPSIGPAGYELLDGLTGFGTTAQMFGATYLRAKEGELARTIMASPAIGAARVHIGEQTGGPFAARAEPTASVSVFPAGALSGAQAEAIRYMVASAVAGLLPGSVTVIDARQGRVVAEAGETVASGELGAALRDRALRLVEARVGRGNAVVEVTVDTVAERESIVERRIDPDSRMVISTETRETLRSATADRAGAVTVAGNLPDGDAGGDGDRSSSEDSETQERVNYDMSETTRELLREPGRIGRITVAVLVNEPAGGAARGDDELQALRDLVASSVGLDETRGDTLTVRAMAFTAPDTPGLPDAPGLSATLSDGFVALAPLALAAIVVLALGLFVVRPVMLRAPAAAAALPGSGGAGDRALVPPGSPGSAPAIATPPAPATQTALAARAASNPDDFVAALEAWMQPPAADSR